MECVSNKGRQCMIFQNNKFSLSYVAKSTNNKTWRCTIRWCNASIHTLPDTSVIESDVSRNHEDSVKDLTVAVLRNSCKLRADNECDAKPAKIIRSELNCSGYKGESLINFTGRCKHATKYLSHATQEVSCKNSRGKHRKAPFHTVE